MTDFTTVKIGLMNTMRAVSKLRDVLSESM